MSRFANVEYITYDEIKKKREEEQKRWNSYEWKDLIVDFYDSVNLNELCDLFNSWINKYGACTCYDVKNELDMPAFYEDRSYGYTEPGFCRPGPFGNTLQFLSNPEDLRKVYNEQLQE